MNIFFVIAFFVWSALVYSVVEKNDNGNGDIWWGMFAVWLLGAVGMFVGLKVL